MLTDFCPLSIVPVSFRPQLSGNWICFFLQMTGCGESTFDTGSSSRLKGSALLTVFCQLKETEPVSEKFLLEENTGAVDSVPNIDQN
jgi:hypothetical protein